ncbi:MAG: NAD(P)H-hydrate dehydratase [Terriglobia bacterium]
MKILTASQMREVDRLTTERFSVPSLVLMENAGRSVVDAMGSHFGNLSQRTIAIFCGRGNNGGDGFVVARHLIMRKILPEIYLFADSAEVTGDARTNLDILRKMQIPIYCPPQADWTEGHIGQRLRNSEVDIVVDALLGIGARLPVRPPLDAILRCLQSFPRVVAIDVPSGVDCENLEMGQSFSDAARAELTVTFTAVKPPHVFYPGADRVGKWVLAPIGSPTELIDTPDHWLNVVTPQEAAHSLGKLQRSPESHKGNYGHVLVVAGSLGKSGAAVMTARSALLTGAGLVTLATPAPCLPIVAAQSVEIMTESLETTESGNISMKAFDYGKVSELVKGKDVLAVGPGIGTHPETQEFVRRLLQESMIPTVLDADGLNAFAGYHERLSGKARPLILTPHPGEFARLAGISVAEVLSKRIELCRRFAVEHQVHLILKGHRTLYADPAGHVFVNLSGNPGMATGGVGDVLTGMLAGLVGQGQCLPEKNQVMGEWISLGIHLHGLAGDQAASRVGQHSLVAGDLMGSIGTAFLELQAK